jgi:DNA repair protein RadC
MDVKLTEAERIKIINSNKSYLSFKDIGLLGELKESTKYVPNYVL